MNVALFFGGRSCEHDISILTALSALGAARIRHKVTPIYLARDGRWLVGRDFDRLQTFRRTVRGEAVTLHPGDQHLYTLRGRRLQRIDAALLCNHGVGGEDGSLQGMLSLCNIPFTGSSIRASAVAMDKITMKQVFVACGLPVLAFGTVQAAEDRPSAIQRLVDQLGLPVIVKPSNLGSSIGISIAHDQSQLAHSLAVAFEWDTRVIVEPALTGFVEANCGVLLDGTRYVTSEVEQPVGWREFLTYQDKYLADCDGPKCSVGRRMPADLPDQTRLRIRQLALDAFRAIGCSGVARIDFLVVDDQIYVNEINTIPGSLANYLFSHDGMTFDELIDNLLVTALAEKQSLDSLRYTFHSPVLSTAQSPKSPK